MRKATVGFVSPFVRLSVRTEDLGCHLEDFCDISYWRFLINLVDTSQLLLKSQENKNKFSVKAYVHLRDCLAIYVTGALFMRCVHKKANHDVFNISHSITKDVVMALGYTERAVCFSIPFDTTQTSKVTGFVLFTGHHQTYVQEHVKETAQ